ncbi:hypothetical protein [Salinibacter altiplanensis]|uniref:hypothetical protein n=1 Tax=Salinibacter altiplanensis TaxID=1803181 RepID=UPI000C9ECECC|nr:hypothetical protein [Salinibacter altiplanensis]
MSLLNHAPSRLNLRDLLVGPMFILLGDPTVADGAAMLDLGLVESTEISLNPTQASGSIPGGHQLASATVQRSISAEINLTIDDMQSTILTALIDSATRQTQSAEITGADDTAGEFTVDEDLTQEAGASEGDLITVTGPTDNEGTYELSSDATYSDPTTTFPVVEDIPSTTADGTLHTFMEGFMFETTPTLVEPNTLVAIPTSIGGKAGAMGNPAWWFPGVVISDDGGITQEDTDGEDANAQFTPTLMSRYREQDQAGTTLPEQIRQAFFASPQDIPGVDLSWSLPTDYQ